ncbi:MAG: KH domain-containing protein [Acidobacteriota bacterium]
MRDDSAPWIGEDSPPSDGTAEDSGSQEGRESDSAADQSLAREDEPLGQSLTRVISMLVDHPEAVRVEAKPRGAGEVFCVRVDPADLGQVIGRHGRTARSLRTLLEIRGSRDGRRYGLEILET